MSYLETVIPTQAFGEAVLSKLCVAVPSLRERSDNWFQTEGSLLSVQLVKEKYGYTLRSSSATSMNGYSQADLESLVQNAFDERVAELQAAVDKAVADDALYERRKSARNSTPVTGFFSEPEAIQAVASMVQNGYSVKRSADIYAGVNATGPRKDKYLLCFKTLRIARVESHRPNGKLLSRWHDLKGAKFSRHWVTLASGTKLAR